MLLLQQFISYLQAVARISTLHRDIVTDKGDRHSEGLRMTMCDCITHDVQEKLKHCALRVEVTTFQPNRMP